MKNCCDKKHNSAVTENGSIVRAILTLILLFDDEGQRIAWQSGLTFNEQSIIMTSKLERADQITKLALAVSILILYMSHAIAEPFAKFLLILAAIVVAILFVKLIIAITTYD